MKIVGNFLTGHDDVRQTRLYGMSLLSRACTPAFFSEHPDATIHDRGYLVQWLTQWLSITGFAPMHEIAQVQLASVVGREKPILAYYRYLAGRQVSDAEIRKDRRRLPRRYPPGDIRMALFGSFAPLTPTHMAYFSLYRMFCHTFVVGLDSDALLKRRKPDIAERYPYRFRRSVIAGFPHLVDAVITLPRTFTKGHDYDDQYISAFIRRHGINVVALNPDEPDAARRREQVSAAGAEPFELERDDSLSLHSRHIRQFKEMGILGFESLTD